MLVLCTVIWGGTFPAVKYGLEAMSPWTLVCVRFTLAGFLFVPIYLSARQKFTARALYRGFLLGIIFVISFGLQTQGLIYTTPSRSAFLTEALVLFVPLISYLVSRKLPSQYNLLGAILVICGLYLLTSPGGLLHWNRGDWLTLGCAIAFSVYIIAVDLWSTPESQIILSAVQCFTVAAIALPLALSEGFYVLPSFRLIGVLAYLVIPGTIVVVMLQMRYQPQSTPARAGVIFALEPVFAMLYAVALSLEFFTWRGVFGAIVVTVGVVWSEAGKKMPAFFPTSRRS